MAPISFTDAVMMGLADDSGLILPRAIPRIGRETFCSWQKLSYSELALEVMSRFVDDIPESDLSELINRSYQSFDTPKVTPIVHHGDLHILELFHGPTLAFKDVALQLLGNLFEYLLARSGSSMNILGATSGDTGSAAIYGVRGKERINIFILHPHQRVSPVQEKQMTSVTDANVFNIAVKGNFDDSQAIVKKIFNDIDFKHEYHLGAVNSINWARIMAQVVYYVYSCLHVLEHEKSAAVDFAVPTGNFGDIFAGYVAKRMLPKGIINKLVLATNANDILARLVNSGDYSMSEVTPTSSPSMDIQAASNFERYLYYLVDEEPDKTKEIIESFTEDGKLDLSDHLDQIRRDFTASAVSEEQVIETIKQFKDEFNYILDPHTAVGVHAAMQHKKQGVPMFCLATAHPAKFGEIVEKATGNSVELPLSLKEVMGKESRCELMENNLSQVKDFVRQHAIHTEP